MLGPHGAGLANLAWLPPSLHGCARGPAVLEFICSKETATVQRGCPGKTHWSLLGGVPWIRYYHVLLAPNSTAEEGHLWVDAAELRHALERIFVSVHPPFFFSQSLLSPPPSLFLLARCNFWQGIDGLMEPLARSLDRSLHKSRRR